MVKYNALYMSPVPCGKLFPILLMATFDFHTPIGVTHNHLVQISVYFHQESEIFSCILVFLCNIL